MKFSEYDEKGLLALCCAGQTFWIAAQLHAAMTALLTKLFMGLIA